MKKTVIISIILAILFVIIYFRFRNSEFPDPRGDGYAGSASCIKCHRDLYNSYLHTAHYIASIPGAINTIHGGFAKNVNVFNVSASQKIVMEKLDSGMFQSYYLNRKFKERHRFDIVLGGVKGESYLYWKGNGLNQLPISYYTKEHKWLMSPRYAPGQVDFGRIITVRCLECHASYIEDQADKPTGLNGNEQFDKTSLVYSVDCERCHGPGARHADFQTNNLGVKTAKFIASYRSLLRARRIDMCAVCHSGNKSQMIRSTFFFRPGDTLAKFKLSDFYNPTIDTSHLDVHGNQVQLLQSSKCFINSKMDCATCHDTHQNQRGNVALFTQKCVGCHSAANHNYCKMANALNAQLIRSNCIQCHMPAFASGVIITPNIDKTFNADIFVHSHHIAIYPQETKKILAMVTK
jgi:Cytochrome c554 and c-prime